MTSQLAADGSGRDPVTDHLLTPYNSALVVIDYQPSRVQTVASMDHELLIDNIVSVAPPGPRTGGAMRLTEVRLTYSDEAPTGVGGVAAPTTAPALANAIAALSGTRMRLLPISKSMRIY